jgi:hypothetical protein
MSTILEDEFHDAMLAIYVTAKREAGYNATRFLGMLNDHGGVKTARLLLDAPTVSDGYTALWERQRLDLTVEAVILENERFHSLFSKEQLKTCQARLNQYGYSKPRR